MRRSATACASILIGLACAASAQESPVPSKADGIPVPRFQTIPLPDDEVSFQRDGVELTRYHFSRDQERPFCFPLLHPESGRSLTRMGHPHDPVGHSHHNSVWISHNKVAGISFWSDHNRDASGRIVHQRVEKLTDGDGGCGMTSVNHWIRHADSKVLLVETRRIRVAPAMRDTDWLLLIELHFAAMENPVTFEENPFGVIGVRMAKTIGVHDGGGRILNSEGQIDEKAIFRKPARWVDYSGPIARGMHGGITLMDHPSNPNHPAPFHVRNDGWMGACLTLEKPVTVRPEAPLRLFYGLWMHHGTGTKEAADAAWSRFSKSLPISNIEKK